VPLAAVRAAEAEVLPSGEVLLSSPSAVLWPPPTPLSRIPPDFGGCLIPSVTRQVGPRRVEVSFVPLGSVCASHPLYPGFRLRLRMASSSTGGTGLRPRSRDSAGPSTPCSPSIAAWLTFTRLARFTWVTGCAVARAHGLGLGPRFSGVAPAPRSPSTRTP